MPLESAPPAPDTPDMRTAAVMLLAGSLGVAEAAISNTSVSFPPVVPISSVSPTTRQFIDEAGQTRFLRGMSVAYKVRPSPARPIPRERPPLTNESSSRRRLPGSP